MICQDTRARRQAPRAGFTLIEMLVAMGLTMFIMVILSQAFSTGLDVFTGLKAVGDMEENLRAAATALRSDLSADHFEGKRRLSDPDFYSSPPQQGFLRIAITPPGAINEGTDGMNVAWRSTSCVLHLSVKRRGNNRQDFFTASVPAGPPQSPLLTASTTFFNQPADARAQEGNTYSSQWAEVAYFLVQTGTTTEPNNPASTSGIPLFALYRVERLVVPDNSAVNWVAASQIPATALASYYQMSCQPQGQTLLFNSPSDLTTVANRTFFFGAAGNLAVPAGFTLNTSTPVGQANALSSGGRGAALVIGNVTSFQVRALRSTGVSTGGVAATYDPDFVDINFDSAAAAADNPPLFIGAVGVSLRVWDQKTQQARQITVMQDM